MAIILTNKPMSESSVLVGHREIDNVHVYETILPMVNKMTGVHMMSASGKTKEEIADFCEKYDSFISQYLIPIKGTNE